MNYLIFPALDATIYEYFPNRNTGIDPILELNKYTSGSSGPNGDIFTSNYNSRILIKFNLNTISQSIASGDIINPKYYLNLSAIDSNDLPIEYTLYAYPVSESWVNGNGNFNDSPQITTGVSWNYRSGVEIGDNWNIPGGTWYSGSGYEASQSFSYSSPDIRMDITDIVNLWISGSIPNNGLILKRSYEDENSSAIFGELKFFGKDTHTIFVPKLETLWQDVDLSGTGSVSEIEDDRYVVYINNIRSTYQAGSRAKLRIGVRPEFPTLTYATSSNYLTNYRLPISSSYAIKDTVTDTYIVNFDDTYTQLSCDDDGNFFNIRLNGFLPERYYTILIKSIHSDQTLIHDNGYFFNVSR